MLQNSNVRQAIQAGNLPKAFISKRNQGEYDSEDEDEDEDDKPKIDRPEVEIELPDFIVLAEEIAEREAEREAERIRILNKTPVPVLNPRQLAKILKKKQKKEQKRLMEANNPYEDIQ